jgi:sigma-E factor negative regulatory protein RseA
MTTVLKQANRLTESEAADLEKLSALLDGQATTEDWSERLYEQQERWSTYQLIGDAMREPDLVRPISSAFTARMSAALARESAHSSVVAAQTPQQPRPVAKPAWGLRFAWPSLAVTAAVLSVIWVAQPIFQQTQSPVLTPMATADNPRVDPVALDYADAHRQFSGPIAVRQASYTPGVD